MTVARPCGQADMVSNYQYHFWRVKTLKRLKEYDMKHKILVLLFAGLMGLSVVSITGCDNGESPAEEVGDTVDDAMGNEGPAEKAGESIDEAVDETSEAVNDATGNSN